MSNTPRAPIWADMTRDEQFIWMVTYCTGVEMQDPDVSAKANAAADACVRKMRNGWASEQAVIDSVTELKDKERKR